MTAQQDTGAAAIPQEAAVPENEQARGQTAAVVHYDESAHQPAQEVQEAADAQEQTPYDPIALATVRTLQQALIDGKHPNPDGFLTSIDNAIFTPGIDEAQCIFLVNRALRLLIIERRDVPEQDRNAALMGVIDTKDLAAWLPPLVATTIPVLAAHNIGEPGLKFTPGQEPAYLTPKTQNSSISGAHVSTEVAADSAAEQSPLEHGSAEWKPEEVKTAAIATDSGTVVAKPVDDAAPCSTEPV